MVRLLVSNEAIVRTACSMFSVVGQANDESAADLLAQRMQEHGENASVPRSPGKA